MWQPTGITQPAFGSSDGELSAARAGTGGGALHKWKPTFPCGNKSACICYQAGGWWSTNQRIIEILPGEKKESVVKGYFNVSTWPKRKSQPPGLLWPLVPAKGLQACRWLLTLVHYPLHSTK